MTPQVVIAIAATSSFSMPPLSNIVFMGMGEPADNAAEVRSALACLTDPKRFGFSKSKVLVSTVAPNPDAFAKLLGDARTQALEENVAGYSSTGMYGTGGK
eukprot:6204059-Pleurochrysis_carterae.AAC.1